MPRSPNKFTWLAAVVAGWIGLTAAAACNVPVFRYALERWTPDAFVAVVFHRGPLTVEQQALIGALNQTAKVQGANLLVAQADVSREMPAPVQTLWAAQVQPALPWLVLRYPAQAGIESSVWSGPLTADLVQQLTDSPARREIARRLSRGDTTVWLLLESGDKPADDALAHSVESESRKLEQTLKLPEAATDDPPIHENIPLKIGFSMLRVARSDPAERMLVAQLLNWDMNLNKLTQPMVFPLFGRGRFLPPAVGNEIRGDVLGSIGQLLTGPCSCQIKEMNAGCDLLIAANWDALFAGQELTSQKLPPLVGISQFATTAATNLPVASAPLAVPPETVTKSPASVEPDHLIRNLAAMFGCGVIFLAVATLALKIKHNGNPR